MRTLIHKTDPVPNTSVACPGDGFRERLVAAGVASLAGAALLDALSTHSPAARATCMIAAVGASALWWRSLGVTAVARTGATIAVVLAAWAAVDMWLVPLPFVLLCVARLWSDRGRDRAETRSLLHALALVALLLLLESSGLLWPETSEGSWWLTGVLTDMLGPRSERLGPAFWAPAPVVLALALWAFQLRLGGARAGRHVRLLLMLLCGSALVIAYRQQALAALLPGFAIVFSGMREPTTVTRTTVRRPWLGALGAAACVAGVALALVDAFGSVRSTPSPTKLVGVLDAGMRSLDPPPPDFTLSATEANFGTLLDLLPAHGWSVLRTPLECAPTDLHDLALLIVINLDKHLSEGSQEAVEEYVRAGGRLLVLGDHTDIGGVMSPLNGVLGFTSIRFLFDSAIPIDSPTWKWRSCLRAGFHPAFFGRSNADFGISVGASLGVGARGRVLVMGDRGYSDWGNPDFGVSRLGDMQYNPGERLGGLPLVAQERVGDGVVEVWGDTTGFQTSVLTGAWAARLAAINDLVARTPMAWARQHIALASLALVVGGVILLVRSPLGTVGVVGLATIATSIALRCAIVRDAPLLADERPRVVVYDTSHAPLYPSAEPTRSLHGLTDVLRRRERVLLASDRFDRTLEARPEAIVIVEPTRRFTGPEAASLTRYIERGGKVVMAAGPTGSANLSALLAPNGVRVLARTMGPAHRARIIAAEFTEPAEDASVPAPRRPGPTRQVDAEPDEVFTPYDADIKFLGSHPMEILPIGGVETLVTCWDAPLIVRRRIGRGWIAVIGDPRFLTDENLQNDPASNTLEVRNARFLAKLLVE